MTRSLILGGLAVCLSLTAGVAAAQTAEDRARAVLAAPVSRADFVERRLAPLIAMDADRDGTVTAIERRAAQAARRLAATERRFDRLDADKNGTISREEFAASGAQANSERLNPERLNPERLSTARRGGDRMRRSPSWVRPHQGRAGHVRYPDAPEAKPVVIADARSRIEATFDRLDADRDGTVTRSEMREGRRAARDVRREHGQTRREAVRAHRRQGAASAPSPSTPSSE